MPLAPGTRIDRFEILGPLGTGGMGEVYRARDTRLGREVAVKVLPQSAPSDADRLARFEQEAKAVGLLNHPNVLALYEIGTHEGVPYLVTELLEGRTLGELLDDGPVPERKAVEYARQAARGLAAAHEKGIVHRDLKPANLFVTNEGRLKILDFGLAKLKETSNNQELTATVFGSIEGSPKTAPGMVLGTIGYMAPEQVRGQPADHRADIFSLGVVLYHMLTGRRPFEAETAAETMTAILKSDPSELSRINPDLPQGLDRLVRHCLEKNPDERYQSARDLAFELEGRSWRSGSMQTATLQEAPSRKIGMGAILAVLVGVVAVAAFFAGKGATPPAESTGELTWHRQTFQRGNVMRAGFGPDGKTIVYTASWGDRPGELFMTQVGTPGATSLGMTGVDLLSISSKGELALLKKEGFTASTTGAGVLTRVSITGGGAPRELLRDVEFADWSPDGERLAVVRFEDGRPRIEYPIGNVLFEGYANVVRVSPDGERVAAHVFDNLGESISVFTRDGTRRTLFSSSALGEGLQWSADGRRVLFTTGIAQVDVTLRAVDLEGNVTILDSSPDPLLLHDVAPDGRLLIERESYRLEMIHGTAAGEETDLTWLDGSRVRTLSRDGTSLVFSETYASEGGIFLRNADGSPAIRLGVGFIWSLSPDEKWVLASTDGPNPQPFLVPTGAGERRKIDTGNLKIPGAGFVGTDRIAYPGSTDGRTWNVYVQDIGGGEPRIIAEDVGQGEFWISSDYRRVGVFHRDGIDLYSLDGGDPETIEHPDPDLEVVHWSDEDQAIYFFRRGTLPAEILRYDIRTARLEPWRELMPKDAGGVVRIDTVKIAGDGKSYAYAPFRIVSSALYVVEGVN